MYREKILARADEFLSRIGDQLHYTTVPRVLNNGRIPASSQAALFRSVESFVIEHGLVELPETKRYTPGGFWHRLRLSPKGYRLVAGRFSIHQILPPEEITYNRYRIIFDVLDQQHNECMAYHDLKKRLKSRRSKRRSFKRDVQHFEQLGWLSIYRMETGRLIVKLGLEAYQHYVESKNAVQIIRQNPYRKIPVKSEEYVPSYLEIARERHQWRKEMAELERELLRLDYPGVPIGIKEKFLFHTTSWGRHRYGPRKLYPEGSRVLTDERRRELSRFTQHEIVSMATFLLISCFLAFTIAQFLLFQG